MLGDNTKACSVKVFIGRHSAWQGKDSGMAPVMGQGSSCMGDAWRALAEPSWMLALDPDPAVRSGETSSSPNSTAAQVWSHQLHVRAWIVLETLERRRARDTQLSKASIPAVPWKLYSSACPYCRLRQQTATAAAELLPGTAAATQELSMA